MSGEIHGWDQSYALDLNILSISISLFPSSADPSPCGSL